MLAHYSKSLPSLDRNDVELLGRKVLRGKGPGCNEGPDGNLVELIYQVRDAAHRRISLLT